jgi:serine protease Do
MNNKRLLFLGMVALTLGFGVIIGTIVSGGVKATFEQKAAAIALPDPVSLSNTFSQIAAQLDPAVVKIKVTVAARPSRANQNRRQQVPQIPGLPGLPFDFELPDDRPGEGTGTGFIVDKAGFIMTNNHVVERASEITVSLSDNSEHPATVVGVDEATDLAVIKIDAKRDLSTARFGNSDAVKVGDWVLAIGSPFDFDHTVTAGIISAKGRDNGRLGADRSNAGLQKFLQTDAAINPGNSGGPLVNMAGEVIGINTAIVSETNSFAGLGFALPSNAALNVYNQLTKSGKVTRGSIGIQMESRRDQVTLDAYGLKGPEAVIVSSVVDGSPAEKAGLQKRDVITEVDGRKISTSSDLQDYIVERPVGSSVRLGFLRDGKPQTATVIIGDRASLFSGDAPVAEARNRADRPGAAAGTSTHIGITVESLTAQMRRQLPPQQNGVLVTDVQPESIASAAGLKEGYVVTSIVTGGRPAPINSVADFNAIESRLKSGSSLVVYALVPQPGGLEEIGFPMKLK